MVWKHERQWRRSWQFSWHFRPTTLQCAPKILVITETEQKGEFKCGSIFIFWCKFSSPTRHEISGPLEYYVFRDSPLQCMRLLSFSSQFLSAAFSLCTQTTKTGLKMKETTHREEGNLLILCYSGPEISCLAMTVTFCFPQLFNRWSGTFR